MSGFLITEHFVIATNELAAIKPWGDVFKVVLRNGDAFEISKLDFDQVVKQLPEKEIIDQLTKTVTKSKKRIELLKGQLLFGHRF